MSLHIWHDRTLNRFLQGSKPQLLPYTEIIFLEQLQALLVILQ